MRGIRRHDWIWTAGVTAGTAAFFVLIVRPQFGRARDLRDSLQDERQRMSEGRSDLEELPRLQIEVDELRRHVADFDQQVPLRDGLGEYLEQLAAAAHGHALRADAIEPGVPVRTQDLFTVPIVLKVHGPFKEIYGLLKDIEQMSRLTQVERFDAKVVAGRPGEVQAEMELKVFYRAS